VTKEKRSFDPRRHWHQTQARLIVGGMLILLVVGGTLVWVFYGRTAALTAIACLLATGGILGLLWLILALLERWVGEDEP
jgi:protein-S-isoprenylcysteine O-methyltransferase Ste14